MSAKTGFVLVAAGVALGVIATPAHNPDPQVKIKFIHGPTKYITKKVPGKTVTSPPIVMDWPLSCDNALSAMKSGTHKANAIYNNAKVYFDYINKVQVSQLDNPISVSQVAQWFSDHKEKIRSSMQDLSYDASTLDVSLEACNKAIKETEKDAQTEAAAAR